MTPETFKILRDRSMYMLMRMGHSREDAEDATMDAFVLMLKTKATFEGRAALATWFTSIALNAGRMKYRHEHRKHQPETMPMEVAGEVQDQAPRVDDLVIRDEMNERVLHVVAGLSDKLREAVASHYFEERTIKASAQSLGITLIAAKARVHQARRIMRAALA